jgi:hypothetical protein
MLGALLTVYSSDMYRLTGSANYAEGEAKPGGGVSLGTKKRKSEGGECSQCLMMSIVTICVCCSYCRQRCRVLAVSSEQWLLQSVMSFDVIQVACHRC